MMLSDNSTERLPELFHRDGVYYARLSLSISGEQLDVALHGVSSEEQALAAARALMAFGAGCFPAV